ncbi:MAG: hemerythrin domain-containing protein [Candidatus Binatia bacterium]
MAGKIHRYLADDHRRLDALIERATAAPEHVGASAYAQFRAGLLKHIGMEEKVLFPAAQKRRGGEPLPVAARLRLDHGALAALLVPPPVAPIIAAIRTILDSHNPIEEDPGGMYDQCEEAVGNAVQQVLYQLQNYAEVKVLPHVNSPFVIAAARRALARAGYNLEV